MTEEGIIERFTVTTRTGNVKAMIEISVEMNVDTTAAVGERRMVDWEEVDFVWQVSGEDDIVLVVDAVDTRAVNELISQAREMDEVKSTKTRLILDERLG